MKRLVPLSLLIAVMIAGCGTTTRTGSVGSTLAGKSVTARLYKVVDKRPNYVGVHVGICNKTDQAIISWHFKLMTDGGDALDPQFPQHLVTPPFDSQRTGCGHGWILYALPKGAKPDKLEYTFDRSETNGYSHTTTSEHDRFDWTL